MHPILITIGSLRLPTYGTLLVLAILSAVLLAGRLAKQAGVDSDRVLDLSTWMIVVGIVGAKVLMVVTDWQLYLHHPGELFSTATLMAGGVFYGGFLAAALFGFWYGWVHKLPCWKLSDAYAPAIALAQTVGRLGCFSAGCDYGKPTTLWLGVVFTNPFSHEVSGVPLGVRLHPTQLYESAATLAIFGILMWRYRRKRWHGEIFLLYIVLYAVARFLLEFLRGDEDRGFVFNHFLSTSQFIAILAVVAAMVLYAFLHARPMEEAKATGTEGPASGMKSREGQAKSRAGRARALSQEGRAKT